MELELEDYKPHVGFKVNTLQSLVDFDAMDSKELWLIQCPEPKSVVNFPDIDGKELKVKLDKDGKFAGFEDSSGKEFELVVSHGSQDGDATVIIPSEEESKIVGKISGLVSFVRFPEAEELTEKRKELLKKASNQAEDSSDKKSDLTQSITEKSGVKRSAHTRSSRDKSTVTGDTKTPSRSAKRKHSENSDRSGKSMLTVSGSSDRSGKSKKKMKHEK